MKYKSYLYHHGVKGQKWGVMYGPPYPLNDNVKAIAYRGGVRKDGTVIENFTDKDVKKARKIVEKNMKMMSEDDIREYKSRLLMEADIGTIMHPKATKAREQLADAAIDAVSNSVKASGTKVLTNLEVAAVGNIVGAAFGDEAKAMITDGITQYQFTEKRRQKEKEDRDYELRRRQQEQSEAKDEYSKQRDVINDQKNDFKNQTERIKAENEAYKYQTERMKTEYDQQNKETKAKNEEEGRQYADRKAEREFKERQMNADREAAKQREQYQQEKETREFKERQAQNEFERAKATYDMYKDYQDRQSAAKNNYEYVKKEKNPDGTYTYYYDNNDNNMYTNVSPTNLIGVGSRKSKKRK